MKKLIKEESEQNSPREEFSRIIPTWKFILLSLTTFGLYEIVWFYRNWKMLQEKEGLNISPFWRAFFAPFWAGSIAGYLQKYLEKEGAPCRYSSILIGVSYFIIFAFWRLPDPYSLVSFFTFIPMLPLLKAMNNHWQKNEQHLPLKKFTWWQTILIVIGIIFLILSIIGTFIPE